MAVIRVESGREIPVDAAHVYDCIRDFRTHRPRWLPPAYSKLHVEQGGTGDGTIATYHLKVGPREREYRMQISEPKPGSLLREADSTSSLVTTWSVTPKGTGCRVTITTQWNGAGGIGGFFERTFAPRGLGKLYTEQLDRLAAYAAAPADASA